MDFSLSPSPPSTFYSAAMDVPMSSSQQQSPSCAFPSWPRRSSLSSGSTCEERTESQATSYISDDELFPCVFDDTEQDCYSPATPHTSRTLLSMDQQSQVADSAAFMRVLVAQYETKAKKERSGHNKGSRRTSRTASNQHLTPIQEVGE